ncbi:transposase [bacterium]|nr:MAG: transposase [bacterium]
MGRLPRLHEPNAIYHVYCRGNNGADIFLSDEDRLLLLGILNDVKQKTGARVLLLCLMGNHFHLLIRVGHVPISRIMQRLLGRYARGFNARAEKLGHVFQARFKAKLVKDESYLITLFTYIHNNPVKEGWVQNLADWVWSSHHQIVGPIRSVVLDVDETLSLLGETRTVAMERYRRIMSLPDDHVMVTYDDAPLRPPVPRSPDRRPSLDSLVDDVRARTGIDLRTTPGRCRNRVTSRARRTFCAAAARYGYGVAEIARCLSLSVGAVGEHLRASA